jgi:hypothetical protein
MAFEVASVKPSKLPKIPSYPLDNECVRSGRPLLGELTAVGIHFIRI